MKLILDIADVLHTELGIVLVGVNPLFNNMSTQQIKEVCAGKKIFKSDNFEIDINIVDIQVTESMWGGKNIFCLIDKNLSLDNISQKGQIYNDKL